MIVTKKKEKCNFHIKITGHQISQKSVSGNYNLEATYCTHFRKLCNGCCALPQIKKIF